MMSKVKVLNFRLCSIHKQTEHVSVLRFILFKLKIYLLTHDHGIHRTIGAGTGRNEDEFERMLPK